MDKNEPIGIIWDKETLKEWKEHAEEQSWQELKAGKINHIQYTNRILAIRKWVKNELLKLNN